MSATETPLVTPDALNKILTAENADLRMREQVGKEANDKMRERVADLERQASSYAEQTARAITQRDVAQGDLAARDALIGDWVNAAKGILADPLAAALHHTSLPALRSVLARTPADAGAELERLRKAAKDALHERDCCHEIYDAIRRALGYPDGTGYPMLAPEVAKVIAERDALRAQLANADSSLRALESSLSQSQQETTAAEARVRELESEAVGYRSRISTLLIRQSQDEARLAAVLGAGDALACLVESGGCIRECAAKPALSEWSEAARTGDAANPDSVKLAEILRLHTVAEAANDRHREACEAADGEGWANDPTGSMHLTELGRRANERWAEFVAALESAKAGAGVDVAALLADKERPHFYSFNDDEGTEAPEEWLDCACFSDGVHVVEADSFRRLPKRYFVWVVNGEAAKREDRQKILIETADKAEAERVADAARKEGSK